MRALSKFWPRDGHFPWCPRRKTLAFQYTKGHGTSCNRCKLFFYIFAFLATTGVAGVEFWGSRRTGSESLFADAWHMVSDTLGYLIGVIAAGVALQKRQILPLRKYLEYLAALLVFCAGGYMLWGVVGHLSRGEPSVLASGPLFFLVTCVGLSVNVFMWFLMRELRASHSHSHSHGDNVLESNILHTIGDTASSVLVLVTAALSWLFSGATWVGYLDLFLSGAIAVWLMYQSWKLWDESHFGPHH